MPALPCAGDEVAQVAKYAACNTDLMMIWSQTSLIPDTDSGRRLFQTLCLHPIETALQGNPLWPRLQKNAYAEQLSQQVISALRYST